jgi:hypothetical protein
MSYAGNLSNMLGNLRAMSRGADQHVLNELGRKTTIGFSTDSISLRAAGGPKSRSGKLSKAFQE